MNIKKNIKPKFLFKIVVKACTFLLFLFLLLISITFILFSIYKDDITKKLILELNDELNGEIYVSDVSLAPFKNFPGISLKMDTVNVSGEKDSITTSEENPILKLSNIYISLNIIDLFYSKINISAISIEDGSVSIITYPDNSINISNLFKKSKINKTTQKKKPDVQKKEKPIFEKKDELSLAIDDLTINKLYVKIENQLLDRYIYLEIKDLKSSFKYGREKTKFFLKTDIIIDSLYQQSRKIINNISGSVNTNISINNLTSLTEFRDSKVLFDDTQFNFVGTFSPKDEGNIDLNIEAKGKDLGIFSFILAEGGVKNLRKGEFYFNAKVKGKTLNISPLVRADFGFKGAELKNPLTNRTIKNLNMNGHFNSGGIGDFSEAEFRIDTLSADFPKGHLSLAGSVKNFIVPEINLNILIDADVTGLDEVFRLNFMKDLKGRIKLEDKFDGIYYPEKKLFLSSTNNSLIEFINFGFNIPEVIKFDNINGLIKRDNDICYIEDFNFTSDSTDMLINGQISNLNYLLFDVDKQIDANLKIKSKVFDLPNFLLFDPSIKRNFPYRIKNIDLVVDAITSTKKVLQIKSFPEIDFNIKVLNATIEDLLPPIIINSGKFRISENILGFNLNCKDFKTDFLGGQFNFTGVYNSSQAEPFYLKLDSKFSNIYPSQLIYNEGDSIPEYLGGSLTGSFFADMQFPEDTTVLKFFNLKDADLSYNLAEDTIEIKALNLNISEVYFDLRVNENPLVSLNTSGSFKSKKINSKHFSLDNMKLKFSVINGAYNFESEMVRLFGKNAKGNSELTIKPFSDVPTISINYNVTKFYAEEMLSIFREDTLITGPCNLSMNLKAQGKDWTSIVNNLNGYINLSGKNLLLYGFDADEIIEKFKRSQNFNLLDLGAVMLAGPVGIAVTKGSDIASIFAFNEGELTNISKIVSNWSINNSTFIIDDAAFTTHKNRVASNGIIDFNNDSLDLNIALVNKYGCSIFSQKAYGDINSPTMEKVKVVGTILAPVTNLIDDVFGADCDVFYDGVIQHPE